MKCSNDANIDCHFESGVKRILKKVFYNIKNGDETP